MNRLAHRLAVALPLVVASSPVKAETNLVVRSSGDCPSARVVSEALWAARPDQEWPPLTASVERRVRPRFVSGAGTDAARGTKGPLGVGQAAADCARARATGHNRPAQDDGARRSEERRVG